MSTQLVWDSRFLAHDPGPGHPESPARLQTIIEHLQKHATNNTTVASAREASDEEITLVHSAWHMDRLRTFDGLDAALDEDTHMSPGSHLAARLAAGAAVEAVTNVWQGHADNAFVLCRPPGHHAEPDRAMGFCLFNNVAIAAQTALKLGAQRVLIVDWDVHHGNGTQRAFEDRQDVLFLSAHQHPLYPGTGGSDEVGLGLGRGYTGNCALPAGQTDADYGAVFSDLFLPVADAFAPDFILVSAGFDAHAADPLGGMKVSERGYAAMTMALKDLAARHARSRLVLMLEGGYNLDALANSVLACVKVLAEEATETFPSGSLRAQSAIQACRLHLGPHWRL